MNFHLLGPVAVGIFEDIAQTRVAARESAFEIYDNKEMGPATGARPTPPARARDAILRGDLRERHADWNDARLARK